MAVSSRARVDLSIIIVSWNVADLLMKCLDSIYAQPSAPSTPVSAHDAPSQIDYAKSTAAISYEVIVVDSASQDDTLTRIAQHYPQVSVYPQSENIGFSRANNIGLKHASGRHLLLLNPDTECKSGALQTMVHYLDAHPQVGIVGPYTLNSDETTQPTRRRFPSFAIGFFESTWLQPYAPKAWLDRYYYLDHSESQTHDVDWVQGSALMARREVYDQIGGLDEGFVMYSEELDWCHRAKNAGWRVVYVADAVIVHHGGKSSEQASARTQIYFQQSKLRYFRKYHGILAAHILRLFLLCTYLWQIVLEGAKALLGHKRPMRQQRIKTYLDVLRSGLKVS